MLKTRIYQNKVSLKHKVCLGHPNYTGHPERPERFEALQNLLDSKDFDSFEKREGRKATKEEILRFHDDEYYHFIQSIKDEQDPVVLDGGDTIFGPGSLDAALYAAGSICQAVEDLADGSAKRIFCINRPPGHHAEPHRAMGFCIFGNVAIGAIHALNTGAFSKIAIVDFDVHHGNGTQFAAERFDDIFFISTHQYPLWPGTGLPEENIKDRILNIPLAPDSGRDFFLKTYREKVMPALESYNPDLLLLSTGFDAHKADHLASLNLETEDYQELSRMLNDFAVNLDIPVLSCLEGGYNLEALVDSFTVHLKALSQD